MLCIIEDDAVRVANMINKLKLLLYPVFIIIEVSPLITSVIIAIYITLSVLPSVQTIVLADITNSLVNTDALNIEVIISLLVYIGIIFVINLVPSYSSLLNIHLSNLVRKKLKIAYTEKISKLKYSYMDNRQKQDLIKRVSDLDSSIIASFYNLINIFNYIFQIIFLSVIIFNYSLIAAIIIDIITLPLIYISYILGKKQYKKEMELTPYIRYNDYIDNILCSPVFAQERNLFNYTKHIDKTWSNNQIILSKSNQYLI